MAITIGAKAEHGFDQPLGLMSDCHRRIERFLDVLQKVLERAQGGTLDEGQRQAVATSLKYFSSAAPRHTQDEEQSLFPLMRISPDERVQAAMFGLDALETEHRRAETAHAEVEFWFARWMELGTLAPPQVRRLGKVLDALVALYHRHIEHEEREIFPLAQRILGPRELESIGRSMAQRRGVHFQSA